MNQPIRDLHSVGLQVGPKTLLDEMAIAAMTGILAGGQTRGLETVAKLAYQYAAELLKMKLSIDGPPPPDPPSTG